MSSRRLKRISNEIKELYDSKDILEQSGIYFHCNEEDMSKVYALLIGPEKTPYEKGFYFFKFDYPENYPMEPPKAKFYTQGSLKSYRNDKLVSVRFNPNLYTDGKICLSMLNTWNGPGWVPTNTLSNVLVAIQALVLNEEPLRNEPGFEVAQFNEVLKYNYIIEYANIKISVLEIIKNIPRDFEPFKDIINQYFIKNIDYYRNFILTQNDKLKEKVVDSPAYSMKINLDYQQLLYDIEQLFDNISTKIDVDNTTKMIEEMKLDI
jgi:ubiquitin-conjugating enzyme E2 Z